MDCGPATLTCLLSGYGVQASYARLREACHTDVDGTSIDQLEDLAALLGLNARQTMLPADHVFDPAADALPAILITQLPGGFTHFVVAWRAHGRLIQVMDPAVGRRFVSKQRLQRDLYVHEVDIPAAAWRSFAASDGFTTTLRSRLARLGAGREAGMLIAQALDDPTWRSIATLDAAARMVADKIGASNLRAGPRARDEVVAAMDASGSEIPEAAWQVRPTPADPSIEEHLRLRGAVVVQIDGHSEESPSPDTLPPDLQAALTEPPTRPSRDLRRFLLADGILRPAALVAGLVLASAGLLAEAVLLRRLVDAPQGAIAALVAVMIGLAVLDLPVAAGVARLGRAMEGRLRLALVSKLARLPDRYIQSRPASDLAERSHNIHRLRQLPELGGELVRATASLILTAAAIAWLDPGSAPLAAAIVVVTLAVPALMQPHLTELDLRLRIHEGALSRFVLDGLLGLVPLRAHGGGSALRHEHETVLDEWAQTGRAVQRSAVMVEAIQFVLAYSLVAILLLRFTPESTDPGRTLLLVYWAVSLPVWGHEVALLARQYPTLRNLVYRLLEPLGAREEQRNAGNAHEVGEAATTGVEVHLEDVSVVVAGTTVVENVNLTVPAGSHVAIVGSSGAGKSTLVGLLLGWHGAAAGQIIVDGQPLTDATLDRLRERTVWVDPAVQLWNRSLADNLRYGAAVMPPLDAVIRQAALDDVVAALPEGLDTPLGEGGALVSGGEGQRVRIGRALHRPQARLVLLDEPFRGLEGTIRSRLLSEARQRWRGATLVYVTHDVGGTRDFDRVVVVEAGEVVEDGRPDQLAHSPESRYRRMLDAEHAVRDELWHNPEWRRLRLRSGCLVANDAADRTNPVGHTNAANRVVDDDSGAGSVGRRHGPPRLDEGGDAIDETPATGPSADQPPDRVPVRLRLAAVVALHTLMYGLFLLAWGVIGGAAIRGELDAAAVARWGMIAAALLVVRVAATWQAGVVTIDLGRGLKRRLARGAQNLDTDQVRHQGAGQLLGRVLEAEALETLALSGGYLGFLGILEVLVAAVPLAFAPRGPLLVGLLAAWVALAVPLGMAYLRRRRTWTAQRLELTHKLVERLVGHRTVVAQEGAAVGDIGPSRSELDEYLRASQPMDRAGALLTALLPRGWVALGIGALAISAGGFPADRIALGAGSVLLAGHGLRKLALAVTQLASAAVAVGWARPLLSAGSHHNPTGDTADRGSGSHHGEAAGPLLEAREITYRHPQRSAAVLRDIDLVVRDGDRILLDGASGSGKSTLVALMTRLRTPQGGTLRLRGVPHSQVTAQEWRRHVVAVPQFHENHVFSASLAFNLLLGRTWPPTPEDLQDAYVVAEALGLGPVIDRMPGGLQQPVGETGWQLSHGERSRLFLARALLQGAEAVVLDETFAALDPENLRDVLRCALERAPTVVVVAHE